MTSKIVYKGNLRTEAQHMASKSLVNTDAPTDNNGKGELFSPTDLVATALGSCMMTVMGIKAEQSKIPFVKIEAEVIKVMAADPRRISEVHISFLVNENWTEKERKIMERTARSCPVAHSLHPNISQEISFSYK